MDPELIILKTASRLLDYPVPEEWDLETGLFSLPASGQFEDLADIIGKMRGSDTLELQEEYVKCFELTSKTPLYLTAWEAGESRNRGDLLISIRAIIGELGFELSSTELPDYIPALLELFSVIGRERWPRKLSSRLAAYFIDLSGKIQSEQYRKLFQVLKNVFSGISPINPGEHELADTAEMPYPVRYEGGDL